MTKRESRLYFRRVKQGIKPHLTNNYKKLHGECMLRSGTMFEFIRERIVEDLGRSKNYGEFIL